MSSSARYSPHRRRSHSATSPIPASRQYSTDKWRTSCKRPRASNTRSPSVKDFTSDLPADKWDVDKWRRGKKARRDSSSPLPSTRGPCFFGSSPVFREQWAFVPPPSSLPSTSDAFQLFPSHLPQNRNPSYPTSLMSRSVSDPPVFASQSQGDDVTRLRSTAFGELQRSIEESGEGLVSRMRDWEQQHVDTQSSLSTHPYSATVSEAVSWTHPTDSRFDDEDDIQIVSGDLASDGVFESYSAATDSECGMDLDPTDDQSCGVSVDYAPSTDSSPFGRSGYASASEDDLPALTLSPTNSACSSQISFPSYHQTFPASSSPPCPSAVAPMSASQASPSEKAIAALTLVMATGAAGLNDYGAVRALDDQQSSLDESSIGEMWH